jgi:hypothetical protein
MEFWGKNPGRNFVWVWIPVSRFHLDSWPEFIFWYIASLRILIGILAWIILELSYAGFLLFWYDLIYWSRIYLKSFIFKVLSSSSTIYIHTHTRNATTHPPFVMKVCFSIVHLLFLDKKTNFSLLKTSNMKGNSVIRYLM